jgi:2-oxoglutarate ferredoxin oxidoreductase subunit delta
MAKASGPKARRTRTKPKQDPLTFYPAWCKKCGICAALCPKNVIEAGPEGLPYAARPEDCIQCRLCELRCPDFAVSVAEGKKEEEER